MKLSRIYLNWIFVISFLLLSLTTSAITLPIFHQRISTASDGARPLVGNPNAQKTVSSGTTYSPLFVDKSVGNKVTLGVDPNSKWYVDANFSATVEVEITTSDINNNHTTFSKTLTINYAPYNAAPLIPYKDKSTYTFFGAYSFTFKIKGITLDGTSTTFLPANLFVDGDIIIDRFYNMTQIANRKLTFTNAELIQTGCLEPSYGEEGGEILVGWDQCILVDGYNLCPEEYQLEWTFVNDYSPTYGSYVTAISGTGGLEYDFKNNSTRVTLKNNNYVISDVFEHGYVVFRVRPVGVNPNGDLSIPIYGEWSSLDVGKVASTTNVRITDGMEHEQKKNWQYAASYAEEGKKKEIVNYFDGSLRAHESVTKVSSDKNTLVGQTLHDFQGRPAVSVLPTPVYCRSERATELGLAPPLKYYTKFNTIGSLEYTKLNFDVDNSAANACDIPEPGAMSEENGSANYYSKLNPNKTGMQAFVPIADGFPFSQTEYTADNTGRIRQKGGVGKEFQLGNSNPHTSRYLYGIPNQEELDRLFGSEVGNYKHYKKNTVIDPNGQSSVSYIDAQGRTIATALAGNPPEASAGNPRLEALSTIPGPDTDLESQLITPLSNQIIDDALVLTSTLTIAYPSNYTFDYTLGVPELTDDCLYNGPDNNRTPLCFSCVYDFSFKLIDMCGNEVPNTSGGAAPDNLLVGQFTSPGHFNMNCSGSDYNYNTKLTFTNLQQGEYTLVKTLRVNKAARDYYVDRFIEPYNNHCLDLMPEVNIDLSGCNINDDCSICLTVLGDRNTWITSGRGTAYDYDYLMEQCMEPCKIETWCEGSFDKMLADVSPGGQYGECFNAAGALAVGNYPLSIYNPDNKLPYNMALNNPLNNPPLSTPISFWKKPRVNINGTYYGEYRDEDGSFSKIYLTPNGSSFVPEVDNPANVITESPGIQYVLPQHLNKLEDFITYWQRSWARSLVRYHPEYIYYEYCSKQTASNEYDRKIIGAETYAQAVAAHLIEPNGTVNMLSNGSYGDPFVNSSHISLLPQFNFPFSYNHVTHFKTKYHAFQKSPSGGVWKMNEAAAYTARCGTIYGGISPVGNCIDFGTDFQVGNTQLNTKIRDKEWDQLKSYYLAEKRKEQMKEADYRAIRNYGYNGCFSNTHYNPFSSGMVRFTYPYSPFSCPYWKWIQPCSAFTRDLYIGKKKCFMGESDIVAEDSPSQSEAEFAIYEQTGQCPMVMELGGFINGMIDNAKLTYNKANTQPFTDMKLSPYPEFSAKLYSSLSGTLQPNTYVDCYYSAVITNAGGSNKLEIFIDQDPAVPTPKHRKITLISTYTFDWHEVSKIANMKYTTTTAGLHSFTADLELTNANGVSNVPVTGTTDFDIKNCSFEEVCKPNDLAKDLQDLFSALVINNDFAYDAGYNAVGVVDLATNPAYDLIISNCNSIKNILGVSFNDLKWEFISTPITHPAGNTTYEKHYEIYSSDPSKTKRLLIRFDKGTLAGVDFFDVSDFPNFPVTYPTPNQPTSIPSPAIDSHVWDPTTPTIYSFSSIKSDYQNSFLMKGVDEFGNNFQEFKGTVKLFDIVALTTADVMMGACNLPKPQHCKEDAYQLSTDLFTLLKDALKGGNAASSIDLTRNVNFTQLLKSYLPYGLTGTTSFDSPGNLVFNVQGNSSFCEFKFTNAEGYNFSNLSAITSDFYLSGTPDNLGNYYEFNANAVFIVGGVSHMTMIYGKTCLPLKVCDPCFRTLPRPCLPCEDLVINYPSSVSVGQSFAIEINSSTLDLCDMSEYTISVNYGDGTIGSTLTHSYSTSAAYYEVKITINPGTEAQNCQPSTRYVYILIDGAQERSIAGVGTLPNKKKIVEVVSEKFSLPDEGRRVAAVAIIKSPNEKLIDKSFTSGRNFNPNYLSTHLPDSISQLLSGDMSLVHVPHSALKTSSCGFEVGSCEYWYCAIQEAIIDYNDWALDPANSGHTPLDITLFPSTLQAFQQYCQCAPTYWNYLYRFIDYNYGAGSSAVNIQDFSYCKEKRYGYSESLWLCEWADGSFATAMLAYNAYANATGSSLLISNDFHELKDFGGYSVGNIHAYFYDKGLCKCLPKYRDYIYKLIRNNTPITPTVFSIVTDISLFCNNNPPLPCIPEPVDETFISPPFEEVEDPCEQQLKHIAGLNKDEAYKKYILEQRNKITIAYNNHCLHALTETLKQTYDNKEYHYTLYYYDQAGNLVRTIPPEGVNLLTDPQDFAAVKLDRANGTHNFTMNHRLASTYEYNSLNQLVRQSVPDHKNMNVFELTLPNGLDSRLQINSTQFITPNKGYLTGYVDIGKKLRRDDSKRGMLYTTDDGGQNWTLVSNTVTTDLKKVQLLGYDTKVGYAVGNSGIILKTIDGAMNWDMIPVYTELYRNGFWVDNISMNDLYFENEDKGLIVGDDGLILRTDDGGKSYTVTGSFMLGKHYTALTKGRDYYVVTVNENGHGYIEYLDFNGSFVSRVSNYAAQITKTCFYDNGQGYAVGEDGILMKTTNSGWTWDCIPSKTASMFLDVYFYNGNVGVSIQQNTAGIQQVWKTSNGGEDWYLMSNATDSYNKLLFKQGQNFGYAVGAANRVSLISLDPVFNFINIPINLNSITANFVTGKAYTYLDASSQQVHNMCLATDNAELILIENLNGGSPICRIYTLTAGGSLTKDVYFNWNTNSGLLLDYYGVMYAFSLPTSGNTITLNPIHGSDSFSDIVENGSDIYSYCNSSGKMGVITANSITSTSQFGFPITASSNLLAQYFNFYGNTFLMYNNSGNVWTMDDQGKSSLLGNMYYSNPLELSDVAKKDDMLIAVGKDGTVLHNDGGLGDTWTFKPMKIVGDLNAANFYNNGDNGIIAGNNGKLWQIEINSAPATAVQNMPATENLNDVIIDKDNNAYVCGDKGTLIYFPDCSNPLSLPVLASLRPLTINFAGLCVKYSSASSAIVVGSQTGIYHYFGSTGAKVKSIFPAKLNEVNFSNTQDGYVVGDYSFARYTNNGAISWQPVPNDQKYFFDDNVTGVSAFVPGKAWIARNGKEILRLTAATLDLTTSINIDVNKIRLNANENGWAAGSAGSPFQIITSGGNTTAQQPIGGGLSGYNNLQMISEDRVIAVGDNGGFLAVDLHVNGSPSSITSYLSTNGNALRDVHFFDTKNGYVVGDGGTFLRYHSDNPVYTNSSFSPTEWTTVDVSDEYLPVKEDADINCLAFSTRNNCFFGGKNHATERGYARLAMDESGRYSSRFWYDRLGRLVLSQNTKQHDKFGVDAEAYSYTKYDVQGRIVEVGEIKDHKKVNDPNHTHVFFKNIFGDFVDNAYNPGVINKAKFEAWLNSGKRTEVTHTYYDAIAFSGLPVAQANLRGRVVSVTYQDLREAEDNPYNNATHYSYDIHGNVKSLLQENRDIPVTQQRFKRTDYSYDLISGKVNQVDYQKYYSDQFYHQYEYDADNRLTNVKTSRDKIFWDQDAKYFYYQHGPLARVELGDQKVQGIDYAYTLQGWIKGVNSNHLLPVHDIGNDGTTNTDNINHFVAADAFGYTLGYFENDFKPINPARTNKNEAFELPPRLDVTPFTASNLLNARNDLYNGNISNMVTSLAEPVNFISGTRDLYTVPKHILGSAYKYDQLNRLVHSRSFENQNELIWTYDAGNNLNSNGTMYENTFTYDANGNILFQERKDQAATIFDQLIYGYNKDGNGKIIQNRLYHVDDGIGLAVKADDIDDMGDLLTEVINQTTPYLYDEIGNLIHDKNEKIENINWTVTGKVKSIETTYSGDKTNLSFDYDVSGNRIAKHEYDSKGAFIKSTYYSRDAQGNIMATYTRDFNNEANTLSFRVIERDIYGSSRLGIDNTELELVGHLTPWGNTPPTQEEINKLFNEPHTDNHLLGLKQYECSNHLGNVLATLYDYKVAVNNSNDGGIDYYEPKIKSTSDYYPFGAPMAARTFGTKYRFGFNGQEKTDEISGAGNHNTALFWEYDTRLGRRWNLDPKPQISICDYAAFGNNPILNIDPQGDDWFKNNKGDVKWDKSRDKQLGKGKNVWTSMGNTLTINTKSDIKNPNDVPVPFASGNKLSTKISITGNYDSEGNVTDFSYSYEKNIGFSFGLDALKGVDYPGKSNTPDGASGSWSGAGSLNFSAHITTPAIETAGLKVIGRNVDVSQEISISLQKNGLLNVGISHGNYPSLDMSVSGNSNYYHYQQTSYITSHGTRFWGVGAPLILRMNSVIGAGYLMNLAVQQQNALMDHKSMNAEFSKSNKAKFGGYNKD